MEKLKSISILVQGKVQGVYFRKATKGFADSIGLKGFVKNLPNGDVYIEATANQQLLDEFIRLCRKGSAYSNVKHLVIEEIGYKKFLGFEIR